MFVDTSLSEPESSGVSPAPQRAFGSAHVAFKTVQEKTKIDRLFQTGCAKIRLPKSYDDFAEAVLINTSGGITGGDQLEWGVSVGKGANAVVTTQASERAYKATTGVANITTRIDVASGGKCHWLPQETILFDQSAISRGFEVHLEDDCEFVALEAVMLGRAAMGERVKNCFFKDRWRIYRDKELVFADDVKLDGDIFDIEVSNALMNQNRCFATLLYLGPESDEELDVLAKKIRKTISSKLIALSAFKGKLVVRALARDTYELRKILIPILKTLRAADVPKVWRL